MSILKVISLRTWARLLCLSLALIMAYGAAYLIADELQSSRLQASYLSEVARDLTFRVEPGPSSAVRFPQSGPYDERLGYSQIPCAPQLFDKP